MDNIKEIIKRYYRGETSMEEEKFLKAQFRAGYLKEDPFLSLSYPETPLPAGLNEKIRLGIRKRKKSSLRRIYITVGSIAAAGILLISLKGGLSVTETNSLQLSDNTKRARFEDALRVIGNVLENPASSKEKILYEDKNLIIAIE